MINIGDMKNVGIRIYANNKDVLFRILQMDEIYCAKQNWKVLFIEGTYIDDHTIEFEKHIRESAYGISVSIAEIKETFNKVNDLWELLLIGQCKKTLLVKSNDEDIILFNSSDIVIEYFDSSYWTVSSSNIDFIEKVKIELGKIYSVEAITW